MNQKENEFITASTVFSSDAREEQPIAEVKYTVRPEVYYG